MNVHNLDDGAAVAPAVMRAAKSGPVVVPAAPAVDAADPPWTPAPLAWYSVAMISLVAVFGSLDQGAMSLMVNNIKRDMQLSDVQMGLLVGAAYSTAYFLCGLPMARVSDSGKRKFILPGGLALFSLGAALCGIAQSFTQFVVCRLVMGAGMSVKGPVSVSLIPDLIPRKHLQRAFSVYNLSIQLSMGVAMMLGGFLLGHLAKVPNFVVPGLGEIYDWQVVFFVFGAPGILVALLMMATMPEPVRRGRKTQGKAPLKDLGNFLFKSKATWVLIPILLASAIGGIENSGIGTWRPAFYERTYGWKPQDFGPIVGASTFITVPIGLILGTLLSEYLAKKKHYDSHLKVVFISHVISLPLTIVAPLMPTIWLALGCTMLGSVVTMMAAPAQLTAMQIVTPNEMRAQVNALYMLTIAVIGIGFGPVVVGGLTTYVFQESELRLAMVAVASVGGPLSVLLIWRTLKPYGELQRQLIEREG